MTQEMGRNKRTHLLFLLLALLHVCTITKADCPSLPVKGLTCYSDYNRIITCVWNSTVVADRADAACTIYAERVHHYNPYHSSCNLQPIDVSRPAIQKCSMIFRTEQRFLDNHVLNISVNCNPVKQSLSISYKPSCHIKLNPPPRPEINFTSFSWSPQVTKPRVGLFHTQLLWKQQGQSWSDPSVWQRIIDKHCEWDCRAEIATNLLIPGERYEARVRAETADSDLGSIWSDWSPTATWVSPIGEAKPTPTPTPTPIPPPSDVTRGVLGTLACVVLFALLLILFRTNKTTWIYITKTIRGPPLPNPEKSSVNFQNWLSPHFTSESFHSFLRPVDTISVEVTSVVDAVAPSGPEAALQEKMKSKSSYDTTSSNFSNPSYSQMSPPPPLPPVSLLTAGNLEACGTDTPYGPVGSHGEGKSAEQVEDEVRAKEEALLQLLSKRSNNSESMLVISDYEMAEKPQIERLRLQSLDSGVCSGEEVSQESLEADSINGTDCQDDGPEGKGEREGGNEKEVNFHKLFGGMFDKGSIQVCSGYEQVQKLQADGAELPSLDSGISSGSEEQLSQEESLEDIDKPTESTSLLFPSPSPAPPSSALACSSPSFTPLPLNFWAAGLSAALPPPPSQALERIALMSTIRSVEPSGDGYMPVRQEQS
ncbi:uncharacterized protein LOC143319892 [Chaetodon auriga]|uniref:uncharacterized protein LOC143319892 n=1 Tax=Chaetodon auriga TaxID=39042 RepID=UPI004032F386